MILAAPSETRIAHFLLDSVVEDITSFVNKNSASVIDMIGPAAAALLTIYVILWGVAVATGQAGEAFHDGAKRILRMCLIVSLALTAGVYQSTLADFFLSVPSALAASMSNPNAGEISGNPTTLATALDASLQKGIEVGSRVWSFGDNQDFWDGGGIAYYILAIIIYFAVGFIVAAASGIIFVAFIATALLLSIGPIFILLALFPATQRFFDLWLGQLLNYAILFVLVACAVSMCFTTFDRFVTSLPASDIAETTINAVKVVGATIAIVTVLIQTYGMASALGGGAALSAQGVASRALRTGKSAVAAGMGAARGLMGGSTRSSGPLGRQSGYQGGASETLGLRSSAPAPLRLARRAFHSNE